MLDALAPLLTAGITLLAGWLGALYGVKQLKAQKRLDFAEKQLREFYSPLLGLRKEVEAKGLVRLKLKTGGDKAFAKANNEDKAIMMGYVKKEIEYNNTQLKEDLLPKYHRMLDIFRDNIGLAEPETIVYFPMFLEFLEVFDRYFKDSLIPDALIEIGHDEERLKPFYHELETRTASLSAELKGKSAWPWNR